MATLPLGISVSVSGASQTIASMGRVANATKRIGAGTIALGTAIGVTGARLARAGVRFAESSLQGAAQLAEAARQGQEVSDKFTDSGLAAAERINKKWQDVKLSLTAAFVNALPQMERFFRQTWAWSKYVFGVVQEFGRALWKALSLSFDQLWEKAKVIGGRLAELSMMLATGNVSGAGAFLATFKAQPSADLSDELNKIWGAFSTWSDRTTGDYLLLQDDLARANQQYMEAQTALVRNTAMQVGALASNLVGAATDAGTEKKRELPSERTLPEAMIRGTVEELASRNRRASNDALALQRQQLIETRKQTAALMAMGGDSIAVVSIA